jgi:DNA-binding response OmpR family regulator
MDANRRDQLKRTLRSLARAHAAAIELMEQALALVTEELPLTPLEYFRAHPKQTAERFPNAPYVNYELLTVEFRGRSCFLGNTLSFRLFARLFQRPNAFLTYEELFTEVWQCNRSDAAVRSAVKRLRSAFRREGMNELADAIDGSVPGHYALKLKTPAKQMPQQ